MAAVHRNYKTGFKATSFEGNGLSKQQGFEATRLSDNMAAKRRWAKFSKIKGYRNANPANR